MKEWPFSFGSAFDFLKNNPGMGRKTAPQETWNSKSK